MKLEEHRRRDAVARLLVGIDRRDRLVADDVAARDRNARLDGLDRITSYNVCYTKLLREDVKWVVPHQANMRINKAVVEYLGIDENKVLYNIRKFANTTAATIPLLLAEYTENGTIRRGDLMLMPAFGAGFVWGASLVRY